MTRILIQSEGAQTIVKHCGLLIRKNQFGGCHLGIVYKRDGAWRFMHLAWHYNLQDEEMPKAEPLDVWINPEPALLDIHLEPISAFCRLVAEQNVEKGLPYAFSKPSNWFDPNTGVALLGDGKVGLTCASFVMAVFSSIGFKLVLENSWQLREQDPEFQEFILRNLERGGAPKEYIELARRELPIVRFRPEEVAGAATCESVPADFENSVKMSLHVLESLKKLHEPASAHASK